MSETTALTIAAEENRSMMEMIMAAARDPAIDPAKLSALLDVKERMMNKQAEFEANQAFARVCKAMPRIKKNGLIDFGKGQKPIPYAKWEDVQDAIRPIYEAEKFTLSFDSEPKEGGGLLYHAILLHENGHSRKSSIPLPLDTSGGKQNIQGMGSSASYGQRYTTKQLFNLVFEGEDDDGVRGGMEFITPEQCQRINDLLAETKADVNRFMQFMSIAEVANIQQRDLQKALVKLLSKKEQMVKR